MNRLIDSTLRKGLAAVTNEHFRIDLVSKDKRDYLKSIIDYYFVVLEGVRRAIFGIFETAVVPKGVALHASILVIGGPGNLSYRSVERKAFHVLQLVLEVEF